MLDEAPLRIECFDVSHVQGTNVVASMVVFEDGLPRKSEYRRFGIRGAAGAGKGSVAGDDTAWIYQVVRRRMARYLDERISTGEEAVDPEGVDPGTAPVPPDRQANAAAGPPDGQPARGGIDPQTGRPRKFAYPPNLLVVDGGSAQVEAAARALAELGVEDVALAGLAKRLEEVWQPGSDAPVILPRSSEGLYLLQRVRDEAHRFAITYHRQKRSRAMTASVLDSVPGLGETRKKALLTRFGSLKRLRDASVTDIMAVPGVGRRTAEAVVAALARPEAAAEPAVDATTGEIVG